MPVRPPLIALALLVLGTGTARAYTLEILHFNDFHSRIESINKYDSTCSGEDEAAGACFGGAARMLTEIDARRDAAKAKDEAVLVLNAGDVFQGSLFFTTYSGKAELDFMNRLGLDAMVVGNHEFDLGPGPLAEFIKGANFPVLFGNATVTEDPMLGPLAEGPRVLEAGGEKIGIVGAVTPETATISTPGPTVRFEDPAVTIARDVAALEGEGVNKIILLSHLGAPEDIRIAGSVAGIDAVIGGHTHTLFSNSEGAPYPYPLMVDGPGNAKVPVVSAGAYSKYLGDLTLTFDDQGAVTAAGGDTILLDRSVTPDPGVLKDIKTYSGPIEALKAKRVGEVGADIDGSRESCRARECAMGDLVADAMLDRVKGQGVTIALQNGGGLRASIGAGEVSMGEVLAVLPFQNTLSTFNISGAGIVAALENGVSEVEEGAGRFPQVAGLRFTWDPAGAPNGGRIREVLVAEGDGWAPIDRAKVYTVVTNNFMRNGGDGYAVLRDQGDNAYDYGPNLEDVLADYLAARPGYTPPPADRITRAE
ncbi:bifunctional metallophosphatase/5'-nucleotidase [Amaricoccus solimangrovi]|uniref:Multifunctional 2',3'-cyclic-nucleotide 2'-phosphodiesterase/5'-nucleotidase/3'-nucleotidase n=1 Tax=Amaricoccus solimangrovi TaxID=2589815 RepID=A0A501WKX9_9RHOB|nr:5'-nucleotidase C-terminal domain-containing protein [Amaricoccus solimangrovi]TPE48804.1 multifunctional 2',3'-cyclic-nucleotide 2'-phosphodiesterase/5'-nucleotidase/3'-nucleotidase [Amaricoccus solimangrovi]